MNEKNEFKPYIPADKVTPEITVTSVIMGILAQLGAETKWLDETTIEIDCSSVNSCRATFELVNKYVDEVVTVSDDEISAAILALIEQQKLIAEGAGAVAVAAVMNGKIPEIDGKNVCCLVSGGNIDVTILSRVIERGLKMGGRTADIRIALSIFLIIFNCN